MRTRVLPKEEWGRLSETELPCLLEKVKPEDADVLVVEDGDRIVGCVAAVRVTHLEGLWIAPNYRGNAGLGRRLVRSAQGIVRRCGWVVSGVASDCMRDVMERLGAVKLERDTYVFASEDK